MATDAWIAEYNASLKAFVPGDKMSLFFIGKGCYVGDTARPGAFVQGGLFRRLLVESARTDFDTLLIERQQQPPTR